MDSKYETDSLTVAEVRRVDVAGELTAGLDITLDPAEAARLRTKIDLHLMPLMCIMYLITFGDKITLGQSAILGIFKSADLDQNQFNWLGTVFYLAYLAFQYPQNLALQRFPVGKWMSVNIFIWALALLAHAACRSFGGLLVARFVLGMCEGCITPGFMIVTSMFYTRDEQMRRVGWWYSINGVAIILMGLISYGVLHVQTSHFKPWQWLMVIFGACTLAAAIIFWFFFPDSPANAWFLTPDERVKAIERIKVNQTGIENKHFKREQFVETFKDKKIWLLALFPAVTNIVNSLTNQRQLLINQFGFPPLQSTLLGCVDGVIEIITIFGGVTLASYWKNGRAYAGALIYVPAILGSILIVTLPTHAKVGRLVAYWLSIFSVAPAVIFLGWVGNITAGHTKRITTNATVLSAYAIGNAAGTFIWQRKYQPRNQVPFEIITVCFFVSGMLLLILRRVLAAENERREREERDSTYDEVFISGFDEKGKAVKRRVDKAFLDLTDVQNREFRYVL